MMGRMAKRLLLALLLALAATASFARDDDDAREFHGKLSLLPSFEKALGEHWRGPSGLVVDDVDDSASLDETTREIADRFKPLGITAFADFSYTRTDVPRVVTVRVFVFEDTQAARAWWQKKYEHPGWEQFYEKTSGLGDRSVKSRELRKEMTLKGNVWMTSHQLHEGGQYHDALVHYLKQVAPLDEPNRP